MISAHPGGYHAGRDDDGHTWYDPSGMPRPVASCCQPTVGANGVSASEPRSQASRNAYGRSAPVLCLRISMWVCGKSVLPVKPSSPIGVPSCTWSPLATRNEPFWMWA